MGLELIDRWVAEGDAGAVAAALVDPAGVRDLRLAGDAHEDTLFALASLTKPLVAVAVLLAVEEEVLDLDQPVGEHLAPYRDGERASITPRHLLAHASGLPEDGPRGVPPLEVEPQRPPATRRVYSNEGYNVLAELLDAVTDMPYRDYVREAVFEPLRMDAQLGLDPRDEERAAEVRDPGLYRPGVAKFNSRAWRDSANAAGGAFATAAAYAELVRLLLARGAPLLAEETFDDLSSVQFPGLAGGVESFLTWDEADWGLGPELRDRKDPHWTGGRTSASTMSHFGASGTLMWADPEAGLGLVCLANRGTYSGWMMQPGRWTDLSDSLLA
jgi:CubicO group peptidase (beta-lactamase class C family)